MKQVILTLEEDGAVKCKAEGGIKTAETDAMLITVLSTNIYLNGCRSRLGMARCCFFIYKRMRHIVKLFDSDPNRLSVTPYKASDAE